MVPNIGAVHAKILLQHFNADEIFKVKTAHLEKLEGIGSIRAESIRDFRDFSRAEAEIRFIEKNKIRALFLSDPYYPKRLLNCYDPPTLLFYKGEADLNTSKVLAIVGTRNYTDYGKKITEKIIAGLSEQEILVISGLAYGIDAIAHKAALKNQLTTVGVVGHGLDTVYPPDHIHLVKDMLAEGGGILTQFISRTKPDKHNFPIRNRIVAGLSDATLVVETGIKGGSMITAEMANGYNRDVFAVPGRVNDHKSEGCNHLIKTNKAMLLTDAKQLLEIMGWENKKSYPEVSGANSRFQRELFIELTPDERIIVDILREKETVHIDELNLRSGLSTSTVAAVILNLELRNVIQTKPGRLYSLI